MIDQIGQTLHFFSVVLGSPVVAIYVTLSLINELHLFLKVRRTMKNSEVWVKPLRSEVPTLFIVCVVLLALIVSLASFVFGW